MHEIISFLKNAVTRGDLTSINGCYVVRNGSIYARNMSMQAGIPFESEQSFSVPAEALDAALGRMKNVQELTIDESTVTVKSGRLRSTMKLNFDEPQGVPVMPKKVKKSPPGLTAAIKLAIPFTGELGWSAGIQIMTGRVLAQTNTQGIDVTVKGLVIEETLLTKDVCAFLVEQGDPDSFFREENAIMFQWDDGRWVRAQFLDGKMPVAQIDKIYDLAGNVAPVKITEDMREAYANASALSDGKVILTPGAFIGEQGDSKRHVSHAEFEKVIKELPKDHKSYWATKVLDDALVCAESWNPASYPNGSLFLGENLRGVVMGRSRW